MSINRGSFGGEIRTGSPHAAGLEIAMGFVQWLNSLDELLYELMSWIVFFPLTLWRICTRPLTTMRYAEEQLLLEDERQFRATVSPPIMLILSIAVSQAIDLAAGQANPIVASRHGLAGLVNDNLTLLLLRIVLYGLFPLLLAIRKLRRSGVAVDRDTLKPPFYAQCYAVSPLAFLVSAGSAGIGHVVPAVQAAGALVLGGGVLAYLTVEVRWFREELGQSVARSLLDTLIALTLAVVLFVAIGVLIVK